MGSNSKIEWTDHTANLWWGCKEVHEGCDNCYAREWAKRFDLEWGAALRRPVKGVWDELRRMQNRAKAEGVKRKVFVGSMMDIFEVGTPTENLGNISELRERFFNDVVPDSPNLIFLLLTKRPANMRLYLPKDWRVTVAPDNVWVGVSVVNEFTARTLKPQFDRNFSGKRFYSIEPQLERIDFRKLPWLLDGIDWVIQGGESGANKRPFNVDWAREVRDVCGERGIPYFFKQVDKVQEIPEDLMGCRNFPKSF